MADLKSLLYSALLFIVPAQLFLSSAFADQIKLDADYPGANIIIEKKDGDTYFLKPDMRDTRGWWFYWNFRVTGAAGHTLHFRFTEQNPIGVRGPALSRDCGLNWKWMGSNAVQHISGQKAWEFSYEFGDKDDEIRFCFAIPYLKTDLQRFLERYRENPFIVADNLCQTKKGRSVERLHLGKITGNPEHRVLLTARHHACESMADYVLEGIMEAVLADSDEGRIWRKQVEVLVIPFVDKDGVEDGDQGKNRIPHDHNRDYSDKSIYPEIAALREQIPTWSKGKLAFAMDIHCPHIRGTDNERIYFVGCENPDAWQKVLDFSKLLEAGMTGPLPFHASDNLPFGKSWNTRANYSQGKNCASWMRELPGIGCATGIEVPYANACGMEVNAETARGLGRDMAHAILQYLTTEQR
jgi:hypothetical protein